MGKPSGRKPGRNDEDDHPRTQPARKTAAAASEADALPHAARASSGFYVLLFAAFFLAAYVQYGPSLDGSFISDDQHYVVDNPYITNLDAQNLLAILSPAGDLPRMVENYAPLHLLIHALEWQAFGTETRGYHVVNLLMHALATVLLVLTFRSAGVSRWAAVVAGGVFLLHPANVEAVAWISQVKTTTALALVLGALLAQPRRPGLGAALFGLALLAKPTAAVGLFVLAYLVWARGRRGEEGDGRAVLPGPAAAWSWRWVGVWALVLAAFALAEFWAFSETAGQAPVMYPDLAVRVRTIFALSLRYLVMAVSAHGLSTFHEPPPATSPFDPWFLGSLVVLTLLAWRLFVVARDARLEAAFWLWAVVSFAPVCGVIPLPFPMADRYLYFMLPGLIGSVLLAGPDLGRRLSTRFGLSIPPEHARHVAMAAGVVMMVYFGQRVHVRAYVWTTAASMMADAERNYPQGLPAQTRIAHRAAARGDAEATVRALRAAHARGYNRLDHLVGDRSYDRVRHDPGFQALIHEIANDWLARMQQSGSPSQVELQVMAQAYIVLDDLPAAIASVERAIELDGPLTESLKEDLEGLLRRQRIRDSVKRKEERAGP